MSVDLGTAHWDLVGLVDDFALITNRITRKSRWVDVRTWPAKLMPVRDEVTCAVCAGATLTEQHVYTWKAPDKRRTAIAMPKQTGVRRVGVLGGKLAVLPAPMIFDGTWKPLAGKGGNDPTQTAIIPLDDGTALVVWDGRVLRFADGALVETAAGDLPPAHPNIEPGYLPTGDGFVTAAGGKLVWVLRHGKQRDDRAVGKLQITRVAHYEDRLLLRAPDAYHLYDAETREVEALDLGSSHPHPRVLFGTRCGLLGLVDQERILVRFRV